MGFMTVDFRNLAWSFTKNPEILDALKEKYAPDHGYWEYLDALISDLRAGKCEGIQEKLADVANNSNKFKSAVSEASLYEWMKSLLCLRLILFFGW